MAGNGQTAGEARGLEAALRRSVRGQVRFDGQTRAVYATDASNYRQVPIGVVLPRDAEDVLAALAACREHGAPVLGRGAGTSLAGQACNVAVVLDFSRHMGAVLEVDAAARTALVEPGCVLDRLQEAALPHGLFFGPDPATHAQCTLGGMIGNNSCGVRSVLAGRTADNVRELEVVTYRGERMWTGAMSAEELARTVAAGGPRGEILGRLHALRERTADRVRARYPRIPRRVSGYNLDELLPERGFHVARALVGSESTCALVLRARLELLPRPPARALLVLGYDDVYAAADHVPEVRALAPMGLEGFDDKLVRKMEKRGLHPGGRSLLPEGGGWLLVELGGDSEAEAQARAEAAARRLASPGSGLRAVRLVRAPAEQERIWRMRESGLAASAFVPGERDAWEGFEDSAVAPERLGAYLRELRALYDRFGYDGVFYGHFGDGCVHGRIDFDFTSRDGIATYARFLEEACALVVSHGGSLSGEHGDGQARGALLPRMFGEELMEGFRAFKRIWDPDGRMNPGKKIDARGPAEDLRVAGYAEAAPRPPTHFAFAADRGSFARAALRCVGVGKCRRENDPGVMCPSFRVTRDEAHSTRGRARLLFEMMQGEVVGAPWGDERARAEPVKAALDLCLACKACKSECPVGVDMATYKAEFLAAYYAGRIRPRSAYAMGLVAWWARAASWAPGLANVLAAAPVSGGLVRRLAGIAPSRALPRLAARTFRRSFARRRPRPASASHGRVILWPDTFNDHFHPETLAAGLRVLESAGFAVELPRAPLCCGRPLYDFGMLALARRWLARIVEELRPAIRSGVPVVGLEPSCVAVFRDEMRGLLPGDEDAARLAAQTFTLAELLEQRVPEWVPVRAAGGAPAPAPAPALVQFHCHQSAVLGTEADRRLLGRAGLDLRPVEGCCGMAGAFGFEREHVAVSLACGERALLPAVRAAAPGTLLLADGFSCREQIAQGTGRRAQHAAEVLAAQLPTVGR